MLRRMLPENRTLTQQKFLCFLDDPDGKRPCLANHYCPNLSFCNLKTKRCQCKKGLVGNGVICRPGKSAWHLILLFSIDL